MFEEEKKITELVIRTEWHEKNQMLQKKEKSDKKKHGITYRREINKRGI